MRKTHRKAVVHAPGYIPDKLRQIILHNEVQNPAIDIHYWRFNEIPAILQAFLIIHSSPRNSPFTEHIFVPAGQEIEAAGHDILAKDATFLCQGKDRPTQREQKGHMIGPKAAEINLFQGIQLCTPKKAIRLGIKVNPDRIIPVRRRAIINMRCLIMTAINELRIQPENIAVSPEHKLCLGNVIPGQVEQDVDIWVTLHFLCLLLCLGFRLDNHQLQHFRNVLDKV